jgi:uncharacterized repeat protein (TIGR01451 family)
VLTYTIDATNTGAGDFTAGAPAEIRDDLSLVLDDAVYLGVTEQPQAGVTTFSAPQLVWTGPLAAGQTVRLVYQVRLTTGGDGRMDNPAWSPAVADDPDPQPPACEDPVGGFDPVTGEPCSLISMTRPILAIASKSAEPSQGAAPGDWVTYKVVATNTGHDPFTAADPAVVADSLAGVLDDSLPFDLATASASPAGGTFAYARPVLRWTGPLAVGQAVTLTYKIRLAHGGDGQVDNTAYVPLQDGFPEAPPCPDDPDFACANSAMAVPSLSVAKSVAPPSPVVVGAEVRFTVKVTNTGAAPFTAADPAVMADDLTEVLDDSQWVGDVHASSGAATFRPPRLVWSGELGVGQWATVTYSVRLKAGGDGRVRNVAWGSDPVGAWTATPPEDCASGCSQAVLPTELVFTGPQSTWFALWAALLICAGWALTRRRTRVNRRLAA